jgi:hypothetical protein
LNCATVTLADGHLAPMIGCFAQSETGRAATQDTRALARWWHMIAQVAFCIATQPVRSALSS